MPNETQTLERLNRYLGNKSQEEVDSSIPTGIGELSGKIDNLARIISIVSDDRDIFNQDKNAFINVLGTMSQLLKRARASRVPSAVQIEPVGPGLKIQAALVEKYNCDELFEAASVNDLETKISDLKSLIDQIASDMSLSKEDCAAWVQYVADAIRQLKRTLISRGPLANAG